MACFPDVSYDFRSLADSATKLGQEYILSAFPFESDKYAALQVLDTVSSIASCYLLTNPIFKLIQVFA